MHVTIVQLTASPKQPSHWDADAVFDANSEYFPDGVTEHTGKDRLEDIEDVKTWFQRAAKSGVETVGRKKVHWIEIDWKKVGSIFDEYWKPFQKKVELLRTFTRDDFISGMSRKSDLKSITGVLKDLKDLYNFDWLYIMDEGFVCCDVADWLRNPPDQPARLYFHATYDGDQ